MDGLWTNGRPDGWMDAGRPR
eukprot:COSAG05_NODE_1842_length_3978_cov_2.870070_1_plen_20_part_10